MPTSVEKEFVSYVVELLQPMGDVVSRSMFGGYGIFLDGLMFGLVANSTLYLKVDKQTETGYTKKGLEPFSYNKKGKVMKMSYYQAPEEALEDGEELNRWANDAFEVALRAASKK
jgi:DNA transformation protein